MENLYDMICQNMKSTVPFAAHAGVDLNKIEPGRGYAHLDKTDTSINQNNTQHSGALFTLAETACGGAIAATFAQELMNLKVVTKSAEIKYLKPAKSAIAALAICEGDPAELLEKIRKDRKVDMNINVNMVDRAGVKVGEMASSWQVKLRA